MLKNTPLQISWDAQAVEMKSAVEALSNVEEVDIAKDRWTDAAGFDFYRWVVGTANGVEPLTLLLQSSRSHADHVKDETTPNKRRTSNK